MANVTKWEPQRNMMSLRSAIDRLMEDSFVRPLASWPFAHEGLNSLTVDMVETDSEIVVKAAVPGVKPEELDISVSGDLLTIKGETKEDREEKETNFHYREWRYGSFQRSLALPTSVDVDKATAEFENGVLLLKLPKAAAAKQTRLQINKKS